MYSADPSVDPDPSIDSPSGVAPGIVGIHNGRKPPPEAIYVVADKDDYGYSAPFLLMLNGKNIREIRDQYGSRHLDTEEKLKQLESRVKAIPDGRFWGISMPEIERKYLSIKDGEDFYAFGKRFMGFDIYQEKNPGATEDEWLNEMYYRLIVGFAEHIHSRGMKVGHQQGVSRFIKDGTQSEFTWWSFGDPAFKYFKNNYDFLITWNNCETEAELPYVRYAIKYLDQNLKKHLIIWVVTEPYPDHEDGYDPAVVSKEIDVVYPYIDVLSTRCQKYTPPTFEETWEIILDKIEAG